MQTIASRLPSPQYEEVQALWAELDQQLGLRGSLGQRIPHFAWQIAAGYDLPLLEPILSQIAAATPRLTVCTTGLGVFTGPRPVIYIPLVKTVELMDCHARLWVQAQTAGHDLDPGYAPAAWQPHIRLAELAPDADKLAAAVERLAFRSFAWEMAIDHLAVIEQPDSQAEQLRYQTYLQDKTT